VQLPGTNADPALYAARERRCDLGYLRHLYQRPDGTLDSRCPAEPVEAYVAKGGARADTVGRKCLCNGLLANIGLPQWRHGELERPLVTAGDDVTAITRFLPPGADEYTAADVLRCLLAQPAPVASPGYAG